MLKLIVPAVIIFLIFLFWEKISEIIYKKFNVKINIIAISAFIMILGIILTLLYY
jgi:hypothetical protein